MEIEFCNNNKVTISMFKYIHEAIKMVSGGVKRVTSTPVKKRCLRLIAYWKCNINNGQMFFIQL